MSVRDYFRPGKPFGYAVLLLSWIIIWFIIGDLVVLAGLLFATILLSFAEVIFTKDNKHPLKNIFYADSIGLLLTLISALLLSRLLIFKEPVLMVPLITIYFIPILFVSFYTKRFLIQYFDGNPKAWKSTLLSSLMKSLLVTLVMIVIFIAVMNYANNYVIDSWSESDFSQQIGEIANSESTFELPEQLSDESFFTEEVVVMDKSKEYIKNNVGAFSPAEKSFCIFDCERSSDILRASSVIKSFIDYAISTKLIQNGLDAYADIIADNITETDVDTIKKEVGDLCAALTDNSLSDIPVIDVSSKGPLYKSINELFLRTVLYSDVKTVYDNIKPEVVVTTYPEGLTSQYLRYTAIKKLLITENGISCRVI